MNKSSLDHYDLLIKIKSFSIVNPTFIIEFMILINLYILIEGIKITV